MYVADKIISFSILINISKFLYMQIFLKYLCDNKGVLKEMLGKTNVFVDCFLEQKWGLTLEIQFEILLYIFMESKNRQISQNPPPEV